MKKKIKLRDLTVEQWNSYRNECTGSCDKCIFGFTVCYYSDVKTSWINNKNLYSDKFLDKEIEINIPNILDEIEQKYLSAVIKPFRNRVVYIKKVACTDNRYFINIKISSKLTSSKIEFFYLPLFQNNMYKGMEIGKEYTLADLGLNNKITLEEFWNSKEKLVIHCNTKEKANKLLKAFDKMGKTWENGSSYLEMNSWFDCKEDTCYSNDNLYASINYYKSKRVKIYEFEDIDLNN